MEGQKTRRVFTTEEKDQVIQHYIFEGKSLEKVSEVCGIPYSSTYSIINEYRHGRALMDGPGPLPPGRRCGRCGEHQAHQQFTASPRRCNTCVALVGEQHAYTD